MVFSIKKRQIHLEVLVLLVVLFLVMVLVVFLSWRF